MFPTGERQPPDADETVKISNTGRVDGNGLVTITALASHHEFWVFS
jgi:hypothetical protein